MNERTLPAGWRREACGCCVNGTVSDYASGGGDFLGPKECERCSGGMVYVTPQGKRVLYPGGPFCG